MIGKTISHYKILEKLGEGGMGIVYKAEDTKLDRIVALKFLPAFVSSDSVEMARFVHEAKAVSSLNHPNIATIHYLEEYGDQRFLVLEYIEGGTLRQKIKQQQVLLNEVLDYAIQIAEGLSHAHKKGIVHRDIKTDNVMISGEGKLKITDFGLAKLRGVSRVTKTGSTIGTAAYMSPEQARGEEVDHRSDIFSFGVVLYELITGCLPFKGVHEAALMYEIVHEPPRPLREVRSDVPDEFQHIIDKAMEKGVEKRYQHVDEILVDLKSVSKRVEAGGSGERTPERRSLQRKRWLFYAGISIFAVLALVALYIFLPSKPVSVERKSIAVLPFKNMSDSKEDEYFSDGITEDIITHLSNIGELKVISRTSVMQYKNSNKNLRDIGKELDVATVLEGSVRRAGSQVRIVAQLIDANNDEHLWAHTYDKEMTQVFAIQSDVAEQIAGALKATLSPAVKERLGKKGTENSEAYELYLRARFHWNKRTRDDLLKSVEYFQKAIEKDPAFALAYAGVADAYIIMVPYNVLPAKESYPKAREAAIKALQLDDQLAEAHTSIAAIIGVVDWDWSGSIHEIKRALELNPNYATAHEWYAEGLNGWRRTDEAVAEIERALELDPFSISINSNAAWIYNCSGHYDKAIQQAKKLQEIDSTREVGPWRLMEAYLGKGDEERAFAELEKANRLGGDSDSDIVAMKNTYHASGWKGIYQLWLDHDLQSISRGGSPSPIDIAENYARLGDNAKVLEWLEKGFKDHDSKFWQVKGASEFKDIRSDPRFIGLLKKAGIPE